MNAGKLALIWTPFANEQDAKQAARQLVSQNLIACANIVPAISSIFAWEGQIQEAREAGLLCKTRQDLLQPAIARLAQLHTYDTPVITGWLADETLPQTLAWLGDTLPAENAE